jgi:hypothetical protein
VITLLYRIIPNQPPTHGWRQSAPKPTCRPQQPDRPPMLAWIREAWQRRRSRVYLSELNEHLIRRARPTSRTRRCCSRTRTSKPSSSGRPSAAASPDSANLRPMASPIPGAAVRLTPHAVATRGIRVPLTFALGTSAAVFQTLRLLLIDLETDRSVGESA